jgi:hypothetical protein
MIAQNPTATASHKTRKFYGIGKVIGGRLHWPKSETKRMEQFLKAFEGQPVMVTMSSLSSRRSDEFHRLYRKRNNEIAAWTGESAERIHELLFRKAGLGFYDDDAEPEDPQAKRSWRLRRFFRQSSTDITNADLKELFRLQSELADELNEDIDPQNWLRLSGEESKGA